MINYFFFLKKLKKKKLKRKKVLIFPKYKIMIKWLQNM